MADSPTAASLLNRRRRAAIACRGCRHRKIKCETTEDPPRHPCARCTKRSLVCEYVAVDDEDPESPVSPLPPNPYANAPAPYPTNVPPTGYMPPYPVQSQYGGQWNPSPPPQPLNPGYLSHPTNYNSSPAYAPSLPQYGGAQGYSSSYGFPTQFAAQPPNQWSQGPFPQQQRQGLPQQQRQQQRCICPAGPVCYCGARS
ncbi:hypothetical protein C8F04DRAFT_8834 [Mycena alexandri]|uniref:Zn(2)-C6 fungal-type domain-containing protein n=1 Tax=Mycena alexandri TaxID=1745969 RepID=A0AAD6TLE5_9AGAR|nr:hypothetical protein C8F04DRAFT_8834 [Mycena alexandri]